MTDEQLITILLGGLGGALASFILQTFHEGRVARGRAVAALRVVRLEIVNNLSVVETVWKTKTRMLKDTHLRRAAFDALAHEIAPALDDEDLSELVSFYSLHETAVDQIQKVVRDDTEDWFHLYGQGAEIAQRTIERAVMPRWALISRTLARVVIRDLRQKHHRESGPELKSSWTGPSSVRR